MVAPSLHHPSKTGISMARRRNRSASCVYCGSKADTRDHVPPKNLFSVRPSNLITVPACDACNQAAKKDDEYFRLALSVRADTGDLPDVQGNMPKIFGGLKRPEAHGFARLLLRNVTALDVFSSGGIFLGKAPGFNVSLLRLSRVAGRVVAGLFYHETGVPLPKGYEVSAWQEDGLKRVDQAMLEKLKEWCAILQSRPPKTIGGDVFSYWFQQTQEDPYVSMWVLIFYKRVGFICMTALKDRQPVGAG
jgi:hypothetical protein